MSLDIKIFKKKDKNKSPLDINNLIPNYFNKKVFRVALILMILLFIFTIYTNNWNIKFKYIECPPDSPLRCYIGDVYNYSTGLYEPEFMEIGEIRGIKPNQHGEKLNFRVTTITALAFFLNHLLYWLKNRGRFFYIPVNKDKWRKIKKIIKNLKVE